MGRFQFPFSEVAFVTYKICGKPGSPTPDACVVFAFSRRQNEGVEVNCGACQPARGC